MICFMGAKIYKHIKKVINVIRCVFMMFMNKYFTSSGILKSVQTYAKHVRTLLNPQEQN